MLKDYYALTKPGIIRGNLFTAIAGFIFASGLAIDITTLVGIVTGTALVIASACVCNNYLDRTIDAKMARTKDRASVRGSISAKHGLLFAAILLLFGILILFIYTNVLTASIGIVGFISYVFVYGYAKRQSPIGTLVGTVPGATPIVAGYTSVTGHIDLIACLLFAVLVAWQMAHFYAIAVYRLDEYKAAQLPVLPAVRGIAATKQETMVYVGLFAWTGLLLSLAAKEVVLGVTIILMSGWWLQAAIRSKVKKDDWARPVFIRSLVVITLFSLFLSTTSVLP